MEHVNVGMTERAIRVVLGIGLFALGIMQDPPAWWGWLGIVPLATGLAGYCPLWAALGFSTVRAARAAGGAGTSPRTTR